MPDYRKFPVERPIEGSRLVIRGEFGIPTESFGGYRKHCGGVIVQEGKVIDSNHQVWWRYANKQNVR